GEGGALHLKAISGSVSVSAVHTSFVNNSAETHGGAVYAFSKTLQYSHMELITLHTNVSFNSAQRLHRPRRLVRGCIARGASCSAQCLSSLYLNLRGGGAHVSRGPRVRPALRAFPPRMLHWWAHNDAADLAAVRTRCGCAQQAGGGLYLKSAVAEVSSSLIEGNEARTLGGGVYSTINSVVNMSNATRLTGN
ncbi:hypothetical protein CYMTET_35305, partial [Cymbomonas tetramitiformis]